MKDHRSSRRRWVKTLTLSTAYATVMGKPWRATVLAEGNPEPEPQIATFKIRISDYPSLAQPFGSVRVGVNPVRPEVEPFPEGDFYPVLINRGENGEFYALDSRCQHASCVVPPYEEGIHCPCHGSIYNIDGSIRMGPTERPLRRYPFEFDGVETLTIQVPGWGFSVRASVISGEINSRLALAFPTHEFVRYEASFREQTTDAWAIIPFALVPDGPADQFVLDGIGLPQTIYVERNTATGFYAVSMILAEA